MYCNYMATGAKKESKDKMLDIIPSITKPSCRLRFFIEGNDNCIGTVGFYGPPVIPRTGDVVSLEQVIDDDAEQRAKTRLDYDFYTIVAEMYDFSGDSPTIEVTVRGFYVEVPNE